MGHSSTRGKAQSKSAHVRVMVWACFTGDRLGPLIVCDEGGIGGDEYEDILYYGLFSLIDDILQPPDDDTIQVADENTFLFMQDNAHVTKHNVSSNSLKKIKFL